MAESKIKKMMKNIEDALTAVSFAEADETTSAKSIMAKSRKVLLGLKEGSVDVRTLKYALNTAKRIGAAIDILYVTANGRREDQVVPELTAFEAELQTEGIRYHLVRRSGCLKQRIIDYTDSEKDILFAVIESSSSLDLDCNRKDNTLSELWRKLKCPLVVVMEEANT